MNKYTDSGVIEPEELKPLLGQDHVKLIDASYLLPGQTDDRLESFNRRRLCNAVFFDIDAIANKNTALPHMLPTPDEFESAVSALGISNDDFIVVYGQSGMVMGPARVWWTFRAFGHDNICVLNGGLPAWLTSGHPLNDSLYSAPEPGNFKASFRPDMVRNMSEVNAASSDNSALILDARPPPRFNGEEPEPRPGLRMGHIPGSINIPAGSLIDSASGKLKSEEELKALFQNKKVSAETPVIASCGSGVTACVIALALHNVGKQEKISIYDGSWAEYGA